MILIIRADNTSMRLARTLTKEPKALAYRNAVLQKKTADRLITAVRSLIKRDRTRCSACRLSLIVGLYRNAACGWPLHSFSDRVRIPEVVLATLTERPGISRWHLLHIMTECNQLAGHIMRRHAGFDTNQALRHIRKPCCDPW